MALVLKDRVKETTATTGTGSYVLDGVVTGFQSFTGALADGDTTYYAVEDGTDWETGLGTWTESTTTLARTAVYESSNSGNAVDWSAGSKDIFITQPATRVGNIPVHATTSDLPSVSQSGDLAYVSGNNRLYLFNGSGWYNIALVNQTPTISGNSANYTLATDGTATVVTLTGTDPEGMTLTWSATTSGTTAAATVTNSANVFTITPSTNTANGGTLTVTFRASDGINTATASSQFSLSFVSSLWKDVLFSIGTSDTNSLANTTFVDRSSNSHSASLTGTPQQTAFNPYLDNYSTYFGDSDNSSVVFGNLASSDELLGGAFTIEAWINPLNVTNNGGVINYGTYTAGLMLRVGGSAQLYYNSTSQNLTMPEIGVWSHICLERDGSNNWAWYINGVQEDTWTSSTTITGSGNALQIGRNNHSGSEDFYGWISNVRVVKGSRVYGSAFTPPTEKLTAVSGTTFLGMQDNRWKDNSSSARAVSAVNAGCKIEAYNPFNQSSEYDVGGNKGSAIFSGTGQYIEFGQDSSFAFGTGDFTVEWWHWATGNYWGTVFDTSSSSAYANSIFIGPHGAAGYSIAAYLSGGGTIQANTAGESLPLYQWTHCAIVRNGTSIKAYINGVEDGSGTSSHDLTMSDATVGSATYWGSSYDLRGGDQVADLKVTKGTAVYTSNFTPPTSPLGNTNASLYLPMDNAGIFDRTANSTFTLNGKSTSTTQTKHSDTSISFISDSAGMQIEYQPWMNSINDNFTWEAWVYLTSGDGGTLWSSGSDTSNRFDFGWQSTGGIRLLIVSGGTSNTVFTSSDAVSSYQNSWAHIALVRSGNTYTLYVDGTSSTSGTSSLTIQMDTTDGWTFGGREFGSNYSGGTLNDAFDGYMEDIQFVADAKYSTNFTPPSQSQGRSYQKDS